ncbi:class I SAM-dependent methyltransferase [Streptomyces gibsoniae]|uniref:Methyltransferase domain-containing protein n=1 Tax=Streptomyces gibsoniae TaxID=3075529 RepID=A0ABU2TLZ2_9ACTN|nr:methyltransferase domain-containing protein [Streptomyces sp. DSM 41699]MDT0461866.1 methyltransferase domain-containing protein [Streptomyces sp. DSM 41699]
MPSQHAPTIAVADPGEGYAFGDDHSQAAEQHRCLAAYLDPMTTARLAATGVTDGWRCLEVGAGGGSIATWLAERVAPTGEVTATDVNPVHLSERPGLRVLRHNVVHDPMPEGAFDLVHARLVLRHLPERQTALAAMTRALRPGGWLQLDEFDIDYGPVLLAPSRAAGALYERFLAVKARMFVDAGADGGWGRRAATAMRESGLVDIDPVPHLMTWHADSPGVHLLIHLTHHLRDRLVAGGMTDAELAEVRQVMRHPEFRASSCVIYSVQGRRPR